MKRLETSCVSVADIAEIERRLAMQVPCTHGQVSALLEALKERRPKSTPTGWATIVRGKVAGVGPFKPRGPGEDGWDYWEKRGYQAPLPLFLGLPEFSDGEVSALLERRRQVTQEGFTPEHDDQYDSGELPRAAACYALAAAGLYALRYMPFWPWARDLFKSASDDRFLDKAIALLLAEKDRLARARLRESNVSVSPADQPPASNA